MWGRLRGSGYGICAEGCLIEVLEGIRVIEGVLQHISVRINPVRRSWEVRVGAYERIILRIFLRGIWVLWFTW